MSGSSKKIQDWLLYQSDTIVEALLLDENLSHDFEKAVLHSYVSHLMGNMSGTQTPFPENNLQALVEFALELEKNTTGVHCAFDMVEELVTLLKDGINLHDILALPPLEYLNRMGWG